MTEPTEPIEAVIAQLKTKCDFGVQNDLSVVVVDPFILSRLLDYVEGMRWRPLESAPRDGTWILLRGRNSIGSKMVPIVARWGVSPIKLGSKYSWWDAASGKDLASMIQDSHGDADWMPLPPPLRFTGRGEYAVSRAENRAKAASMRS